MSSHKKNRMVMRGSNVVDENDRMEGHMKILHIDYWPRNAMKEEKNESLNCFD